MVKAKPSGDMAGASTSLHCYMIAIGLCQGGQQLGKNITQTPSKNISLQKLQFNYLILGLIEEVCSTSKFNFVDLSVLLF